MKISHQIFLTLLTVTTAFAEVTEEQRRVPIEVDAPDAKLAKIALLAGTPSNKAGQHEYFAGCALMMDWLKQNPGVWPVLVADGWPQNEAILDGARAIVCFAGRGVTPLLAGAVPDKSRTTADAQTHNGRAETIAWVFERANGGRSFAFTGCDLHRNWQIESQRRFVINGILWAAKLDVPADGAKVAFDPAALVKNLDAKPALSPAK